MKSRITIEVDFDNGNRPFLQVLQRNSSDVRDNLIGSFLQSLDHASTWCRILYDNEFEDENGKCRRWKISPISFDQLQEEKALMEALIKSKKKQP